MTYGMEEVKTTNGSFAKYQRRRRKRNRPKKSGRVEGVNESINEEKSNFGGSTNRLRLTQDFCQDDHNRFAFLDKDGNDLTDGRPRFRSLPILLEERRKGMWQVKQKKWQCEMLFNFTKKPVETHIGRRQWRSFTNRKIPFTQLGSPPSDAVLAMERNGCYVLTLGNIGDKYSGLALRFYGIYSVGSRKRFHSYSQNSNVKSSWVDNVARAPLLQTTTLHCGMRSLHETSTNSVPHDAMVDQRRDISSSVTPVEVIISKDWKVGITLLYSTKNNVALQMPSRDNACVSDNDQITSMIFFTLPRRQNSSSSIGNKNERNTNTTFRYSKIPMFCNDSRRKMLWSVETIPNKDETSPNPSRNVYNTYFRTPGYLLFNDEGNGYRLAWATEKCFLIPSSLCQVPIDSRFVGSPRNSVGVDILSHQQSRYWVEVHCNKNANEEINQHSAADNESLSTQVSIVNESFLHLDVLLAEILSRRKGITETHPDFCYSLISVNRSGTVADFVIVFTRKKKPCSFGFFVKVHLFSGMFVELDWVRSKKKADIFSLREWCTKLAINRRMKDLRAGPFAVVNKHVSDCSRLCTETLTFDNDEEDDYDESYWRDFVLNENDEGKKRYQPPKLVTLSSLYPCCDIVTNQAIINMEPVMSIRAKDSPIQIVYT